MADKIEIVQVDPEGEVTKTWHDAFPGGWMAARTEFGKMRNGEAGTAAKEAGDHLELRVGGIVKLDTKAKGDTRKKRASKSEAGAPKKKPAAAKKKAAPAEEAEADADADAEEGEPEEPVMAKMTGYMYFMKENRAAAVAAIEADEENKDLSSKEKNQMVMKKGAEMWGQLDAAGKEKWKEDAPMVEKKPKKAKKAKKDDGEPAPKKKKSAAKLADKAGLEAQMEADGWTVEEKAREGSKHVDKKFCPPGGGKPLRSVLEVARHAYPQFLSEEEQAAVAAGGGKKPAAKKTKKTEEPAKSIDDYYLGGSKAADGDAEMADAAPEAEDAEMAEPEPEAAPAADGDEEMADAPAAGDALKEAEEAYVAARDPKKKKAEEEIKWVDDGGKASRAKNEAWKAEEVAADAAERESDDPRARAAWAYRETHPDKQRVLDGLPPIETLGPPVSTADDAKMKADQLRIFQTAHPPTERLKKEAAERAAADSPVGAEQTATEPAPMEVN